MGYNRKGTEKYALSFDDFRQLSHAERMKVIEKYFQLSVLFLICGLICIGVGCYVFIALSVAGDATLDMKKMVFSGPAGALFVVAAIYCFGFANQKFKAR